MNKRAREARDSHLPASLKMTKRVNCNHDAKTHPVRPNNGVSP